MQIPNREKIMFNKTIGLNGINNLKNCPLVETFA
jgi:hypothetical protein